MSHSRRIPTQVMADESIAFTCRLRNGRRVAQAPSSKREATERMEAAMRSLSDALSETDLAAVTVMMERAADEAARDGAGVSALTGEPLAPSAEIAAARLRNVQRAFAERRKLLDETLTATEASGLLGI